MGDQAARWQHEPPLLIPLQGDACPLAKAHEYLSGSDLTDLPIKAAV